MARALTSTTFAAAVAIDDKVVNVASNSGIEVNDILFAGREAMSVISINGTAIRVQRGVAGTATAAHPSGERAYHGQPGDFYGTRKTGVGDSTAEVVLPRVVLGKEGPIVQDIVDGEWITVQEDPKKGTGKARFDYTAAGALTIADGIHLITGTGPLAMTLAAPSVEDEGKRLNIRAGSAHAHTVTITGGSEGASADVLTFGGTKGQGAVLVAVNNEWQIESLRGVTAA